MKILQLCKKYPFPIKDGESIAIHSLAHGLWEQGCTLDLLAMNTPKHYARADATDPVQQFYRQVTVVDVDTALRPDAAFLNLFSKDSYHISRFLSAAFTDALKDLLDREKYDVILLETLYLTPYLATIRQHSRARVVLRAHNVEYEIWERITAQTP
ncbi:MAG: glycosyl transferase family 1, partial [Lewinellaceae bacterium]|nr:glycosyl transferase family 1 [Lewinellaceae bacterium]